MTAHRRGYAARLVPALLVATLTTGCIHFGGRHHGSQPVPQAPGNVELDVYNNHFDAVDIYVIHEGQPSLVGRVDAESQATFTFSATLLDAHRVLRLRAKAVGALDQEDADPVSLADHATHVQWTLKRGLQPSRPYVM